MGEPAAPLRAKVVAGLIWSVVRSWGSRLLSLLTFVVLARYVDPGDIGLLAAVMVVISFSEIFVEQGFVSAIVQRPSLSRELLNTAFALNIALSLIIAGALWSGASLVAAAMRVPGIAELLPWVSVVLVVNALGVCQLALLQRNFDYRWIAVRTLAAQAAAAVVAIAMVMRGHGVWALVAQAIVSSVFNTLLLWVRPQWRPSLGLDMTGMRGILRYSAGIVGSRILDFANTNLIQVILAATLGPALLGIYIVGVRIYQTLMQLFSAAVLNVAHSAFSRLAHDPARLRAAYYDAVATSTLIAWPCFCITGLAAPELVEALFGPKWVASAAVMGPMALLGAVQVAQFYNGSVLNAIGQTGATLALNVVKIVATVVSLVLTRGQPLDTIVLAFVVGQLCVTPLTYALVIRSINVSAVEVLRRLRTPAAGCLLMGAAVIFIRNEPAVASLPLWSRASALVAAGMACYAAVLLILARDAAVRASRSLRRRSS